MAAPKKEDITFKPSPPDAVNDYIKKIKHPLKDVAQELRHIIFNADKNIG